VVVPSGAVVGVDVSGCRLDVVVVVTLVPGVVDELLRPKIRPSVTPAISRSTPTRTSN
jgi:hypothetical protein